MTRSKACRFKGVRTFSLKLCVIKGGHDLLKLVEAITLFVGESKHSHSLPRGFRVLNQISIYWTVSLWYWSSDWSYCAETPTISDVLNLTVEIIKIIVQIFVQRKITFFKIRITCEKMFKWKCIQHGILVSSKLAEFWHSKGENGHVQCSRYPVALSQACSAQCTSAFT